MSEFDNQTNNKENTNEKDFNKVIREFLNNLNDVFPELKDDIEIANNQTNEELENYCKKVYPERFFDILYQNDDIFSNNDVDTKFIPNIDFKIIWNLEGVSKSTKETIWKYLQLVLFSIIGSIDSEKSFGDTAKLFEAIGEDNFKSKLEETINNIQDAFTNDENFEEGKFGDLPNSERLHEHMQGMLNGKIGQLATEIAEETAKELDLDINSTTNANEAFSKIIKNPKKIMDLVKSIGNKLEEKIKSGELKESELMSEASEMMKQMKNMPGMGDIGKMMSSMGIPGMGKKSKLNLGAMQSKLDQNIKLAKTKERIQEKIKTRKKEKSLQEEVERLKKELASADTRSIDDIVSEFESYDKKKEEENIIQKMNKPKKKKKNGKK